MSDCPEGYASVASQAVPSFSSIGADEFGTGRETVFAFESTCQVDDIFRIHEIHDRIYLTNLIHTTCHSRVAPRARHAGSSRRQKPPGKLMHLLKALPDKHHSSKTVLLCERLRGGGGTLNFEYIMNRATSLHTMQIHGKINTKEDDGASSHGRSLNTVVHRGARGFQRQGGSGEDRGRGRRGKRRELVTTLTSARSRGGNRAGMLVLAGEVAATTLLDSEADGRAKVNGQNHQARCRYCHNFTEHGWHNFPSRLSHGTEDGNEQANTPCRKLHLVHGIHKPREKAVSWRTSNSLSETTRRCRFCLRVTCRCRRRLGERCKRKFLPLPFWRKMRLVQHNILHTPTLSGQGNSEPTACWKYDSLHRYGSLEPHCERRIAHL